MNFNIVLTVHGETENTIFNLAGKHFSGHPDKQEISDINAWIKNNPENYKELKQIWDLSGKVVSPDKVNTHLIKNNLKNSIFYHGDAVFNRKKTKYTGLKLAAAIVFLTAFIYSINHYMNSGSVKIISVKTESQTQDMVLPDGTVVSLNQYSEVLYPEVFAKDQRTVVLKGEGYFNVEHMDDKPFVIHAGNSMVTVLGTSFYMSDNPEKLVVIVASGTVKLENKKSLVVLKKGDKGELNKKTEKIKKEMNTDNNFLAWKTNRFVFDHSLLPDVFNTLENVFHVDFILENEKLNKLPLTASFKDQDLETILNIIEETLKISITKKENHYLVAMNRND